MTDDKKYGRTFFDLIAEHPKLTFFTFLTLLLVAVALIIFRVPFKVGNAEVGDNTKVIHDTIIKTKTDTQYVDKPPVVLKKAPQVKKDPAKSISVKTGDTIVTVQNQPANINTGTNNGIIGNNNDVKVNVSDIQRRLDNASEQRLLQLITQAIETNKTAAGCIQVSAVTGNNEAYNFANEILQFLKQQNIGVRDDIGQFQRVPVVKGVEIGVNREKTCVTISVGYRQ